MNECFPDYSPFYDYQISSHDPLRTFKDRNNSSIASHNNNHDNQDIKSICSNCHQPIKFYCTKCILPSPLIEKSIPKLNLPIRVIIWKHPKENISKSTAIHAKILAPDSVTYWAAHPSLWTDENVVETEEPIPHEHHPSPVEADSNSILHMIDDLKDISLHIQTDNMNNTNSTQQEQQQQQQSQQPKISPPWDPSTTAVLYPSSDALFVDELNWNSLNTIILIESTWQQSKAILNTSILRNLPKVKLKQTKTTNFWRYQHISPYCLSSIESLYYFFKEYSNLNSKRSSDSGPCASDSSFSNESSHDHAISDANAGEWSARYNGLTLSTSQDNTTIRIINKTHSTGANDNLLYFFSYFYHKIQEFYQSRPQKSFTQKHVKNYIYYGMNHHNDNYNINENEITKIHEM